MKICNRYPKELLHYDNNLKRRCFRKLKDNVWECKTKWQLLVKAEWTYRYKLLLSCFLPWLKYTRRKIRQKNKIEDAESHYSRKIKYRAFTLLRRNGKEGWLLVKNLRDSIDLKIMRKTWNCWEEHVRKNLRAKEVAVLTAQTRELLLVKGYLGLWLINCNEKIRIKKLFTNAEVHHNQRMKLTAVRIWKDYLTCRKKRKELSSYLSKNSRLKLKREAFNRLTIYAGHKRLYRKHVQRIALFYENYLLKNVLDVWSNKYEDLIEFRNKDKNLLATKMYDRKLFGKCFKNLKTWTDQERMRVSAAEKFFDISVSVKIQFYLEVWRKSLYNRLLSKSMEIKAVTWRNFHIRKTYLSTLMELLGKKKEEAKRIQDLISYCNFKILSKAFQEWLRVLYFNRVKRSKNDEARRYYENKIIRKFFEKFKRYAFYKIHKNSVVTYYEGRLVSKSFRALKNFSQIKQFYRYQIASFQDRSRRLMLQRAFSVFKSRSKIADAKMWNALNMLENKIKSKVLQQWKKHCENERGMKIIWNTSQLMLQDILIRDMILTWWKNTLSRIGLKEDLKAVKMNQEKRLVKRFFRKWLNIREKFTLLRQNTLIFSNLQSEIILQYHIIKLVHLWEERRNERKKKAMADVMERGIILRRFFKQWIAYVNWKMEKLKECSTKAGFSVNGTDRIHKNNYIYTAKSKRKQPMIPAYLREEWALYITEETFSS